MAEKKKIKHIEVDLDIHTRLKQQAASANMSMKAYLSMCLAQCKASSKGE